MVAASALHAVSGPMPLPDVEARARRAQAVLVREEDGFIAAQGVNAAVADASAGNGRVAVIAPDAPPYFQCAWNMPGAFTRPLLPGLTYDVYAVIKVRKKGATGTAFRCGVYDNTNRRYVCADFQPAAAEVPDNEWRTYHAGNLMLVPGPWVYVGPTANADNIAEIAVDCFFLVPTPGPDTELSRLAATAAPNRIPFYFHGTPSAWAAIQVGNIDQIRLAYRLDRNPAVTATAGGFSGVILDYGRPNGLWHGVAVPVSANAPPGAIDAAVSLPWRTGTAQVQQAWPRLDPADPHRQVMLPVKQWAPIDWNGVVWLALQAGDASLIWSGVVELPEALGDNPLDVRVVRGPDELSGFSQDAFEAMQLHVRRARQARFFAELETITSTRTPKWLRWLKP